VKYDRYIKTLECIALYDFVSQAIYQKCRHQRQRLATHTNTRTRARTHTHTHTPVCALLGPQ